MMNLNDQSRDSGALSQGPVANSSVPTTSIGTSNRIGQLPISTQEVLPTSPTPHNDVAASDNLHAIPPEEAFESPNDSISEVRRLPAKEAAAKDDSDEAVVEPHGLLPYNGRSEGSFHSFAEVGLDGTNDLEAGEGREGNRKRRDCLKQAMERLFWFLIWLVCWPIHTAVTRSML